MVGWPSLNVLAVAMFGIGGALTLRGVWVAGAFQIGFWCMFFAVLAESIGSYISV